jgi:hypothetical protein
MHHGRFLYVIAAWGGWAWDVGVGPRGGDGGPLLPLTFIVVVVVCLFCGVFCFVLFLHLLFSIKKPFLQPGSETHSQLLLTNGILYSFSILVRRGHVPSWSLVGAWLGLPGRYGSLPPVHRRSTV